MEQKFEPAPLKIETDKDLQRKALKKALREAKERKHVATSRYGVAKLHAQKEKARLDAVKVEIRALKDELAKLSRKPGRKAVLFGGISVAAAAVLAKSLGLLGEDEDGK